MFNPVSSGFVRLSAVFGLLAAPVLPMTTSAESINLQVVPAPPPAPPAHLVRELLEEDAGRALANERLAQGHAASTRASVSATNQLQVTTAAPDSNPGDSSEPVEPPKPRPRAARLKGIVGVSGSISAIVDVDGRDVMYRAGQRLPAMGHDPGLRLVKIATPCAIFIDNRHETEKQTQISVCLNEVHP